MRPLSLFTTRGIVGIAMALGGLAVPSSAIATFLRSEPLAAMPHTLAGDLLLGASLFRAGIAALGLWIFFWRQNAPRSPGRTDVDAHPVSDDRASSYLLVALLAAASGLRLYGLNDGLWLDEIEVYVNHFKMPFGEIVTSYTNENQHILYSLMAHASFLVFGDSGWALRLPAALFGIGSLWALYFLGCRLTAKREALLAVALLAFSYHHIWFSQNARGYTGLLFFATMSSAFFVRGLREARPRDGAWYAVTAALGVYTHLTMLFVIAGHLAAYSLQLVKRRQEAWPNRWRIFLDGFCLAGLLTFLLYSLVIPELFTGIGEQTPIETWKRPLWTLLELFHGMRMDFSGTVVAMAALAALGAGMLSFMKRAPVVVQLFAVPPVVASAVVIASGHPLWPRFFFFAAGFGALIIVRGTVAAGRLMAGLLHLNVGHSALAAYTLPVSLVVASALSIPRVYGPKQDYRGALGYVESHRGPEDAVVVVGLAALPYKQLYGAPWAVAETPDELNAVRAGAKRTWLVYTLKTDLEYEHPEMMKLIAREFELLEEFQGTLHGGTIFVCRAGGSSGSRAGRGKDPGQ